MRAALRWLQFEPLRQDLNHAMRGIRRSPGIALASVFTLALGIGANTAIFSLLNALMLRPLAVRSPGELVEFLSAYPGDPRLNQFAWERYEHFRDHNSVFSTVTA